MPFVFVDCGQTDATTKAKLIEKITASTSEVLSMPKENIFVVIRENNPDNVGVGGKTLTEVVAQRKNT
ncbi:MAG: 4-oxalocrotonate tautomerase family protein [Firmicutes bacterium]|nr:4-oxalocrotonate tautomerase family protein [Bacillota bacterium]